MLHGKEELRLQVKLKLLITWSWNKEHILDYPGEFNAIREARTVGEGKQKSQKKRYAILIKTWPAIAGNEDPNICISPPS